MNRKTHGATVSAGSQTNAGAVLELVRAVARELQRHTAAVDNASLDSSLDRELGFDSLSRAELFSRVENHFDIALPQSIFADTQTPRDLLRAVTVATHRAMPSTLSTVDELAPDDTGETPHRAETLMDVLDWHVARHPNRPHIRFYEDESDGEVLTYRELRDAAERSATGLQASGVAPGARVALMLPTGREYFVTFFGVLLAGAVPVPIYPPVRADQIEEHLRRHAAILVNCGACALVTFERAKRVAQLLGLQVETLSTVVTADELREPQGIYSAPGIGAEDIAFLQYTSGSTGDPKGVILTHANLLANVRVMGESLQVTSRDVFVSWLPLYHDMGLIGFWFGALYNAAPLVIMSPLDFLSRPVRWLRAIHRHRGTLSASPNFGYALCLRRLDDADLCDLDLSSWRLAINGAEPISPENLQAFCTRLEPFGFRAETMAPVYGLAEGTLGLAFPPLGRAPLVDRIDRKRFMNHGRAERATRPDADVLRFVACGRPLPGHAVRIVDSAGHELPERHEGRVQFQGPSATSGYFRNPEATLRLFDGEWLDTGDRGYVAEGDVYISGRDKDIIIRAGRNIYPHELEELVGNLEAIRTGCVAVFGVFDAPSGTEKLVVLAESRESDAERRAALEDEIRTLTADRVGTPPDDVVLAPPHTILKTSSGKVRRSASRDLYTRGDVGKPAAAPWRQVMRMALLGALTQFRSARRSVGSMLYGIYASVIAVVIALPAWLGVALLGRSQRWPFAHAAARLLARMTATKLVVRGLDNLPTPGQAYIFVANHASYVDGFVMVAALPQPVSFVVKAELEPQFLAGTLLRRLDATFVERMDHRKGAADASRIEQAVNAGRSVLFFPEGTFTRMPGLLAFRSGAFLTAAATGAPVVPIAIRGTRSILRAGSWLPRHGAVTVTIGEKIEPDETAQNDPWQAAVTLRDAARAHILRHSGEPDLAHEIVELPQAG